MSPYFKSFFSKAPPPGLVTSAAPRGEGGCRRECGGDHMWSGVITRET